jgi:hypothetical protein
MSKYEPSPIVMDESTDDSGKQQHVSQQHQQPYMGQAANMHMHGQTPVHLQGARRGDVSQEPKRCVASP